MFMRRIVLAMVHEAWGEGERISIFLVGWGVKFEDIHDYICGN